MVYYAVSYLVVETMVVVALAVMILRIGHMLADCPVRGPMVRAASVTIATGFVAIGLGMVVLLGVAAVAVGLDSPMPLIGAIGFGTLCLGLGFSNAIAVLRNVTQVAED